MFIHYNYIIFSHRDLQRFHREIFLCPTFGRYDGKTSSLRGIIYYSINPITHTNFIINHIDAFIFQRNCIVSPVAMGICDYLPE